MPQVFNAPDLSSILSETVSNSEWAKAFTQFYTTEREGGQGLETVKETGIQKAVRMLLDLHTEYSYKCSLITQLTLFYKGKSNLGLDSPFY